MSGLPSWVRRGASFVLVKPSGIAGLRTHVRGVVDDRAVLRRWSARKQRWDYTIEDDTYFEVFARLMLDIRHGTNIKETER